MEAKCQTSYKLKPRHWKPLLSIFFMQPFQKVDMTPFWKLVFDFFLNNINNPRGNILKLPASDESPLFHTNVSTCSLDSFKLGPITPTTTSESYNNLHPAVFNYNPPPGRRGKKTQRGVHSLTARRHTCTVILGG